MSTAAETPATTIVEKSAPLFWRIAVAAVCLFALFFQLGARGLNEPDEGRYAEVGREMAVSGDYITPRFNGVEHLSKPPVTYWLIAASLKIFGVNEFAARLPAALAALATLVAIYLLTRSALGEPAGLWAAVILVSSAMFFGMARVITTDMILTCFVTWSVWWFWRWYASDDRAWSKLVWFYVFLGLGLLTKGPVAVVLPLFAVLGLRWRNPDLRLRRMGWGRGALIFLAVAAPWFVAVAHANPHIWHYFVVREGIERFTSGVHHRSKAWWYFVPVLAGAFLPWSTLLPASAAALRDQSGRARALTRLCWGWAGLGLIMFSISRSKLPSYMLPLLPALAVLVAATVVAGLQALRSRQAAAIRLCSLVAVVVYVSAVAALVLVAEVKYGLAWRLGAIPLVLGGLGAVAAIGALAAKRTEHFTAALAGTALAVLLVGIWLFQSMERILTRNVSAKLIGECIRREDPQGESAVVSYRVLMRGLPFYLQRTVFWYVPKEADRTAGYDDVYEFKAAHAGEKSVLRDTNELRTVLDTQQRVFCVSSLNWSATMSREIDQPLYPLQQTGNWVLFSTRPSTSSP